MGGGKLGARAETWGGVVGVGFYYIISMGNSVTVLAGYQSSEMVRIL